VHHPLVALVRDNRVSGGDDAAAVLSGPPAHGVGFLGGPPHGEGAEAERGAGDPQDERHHRPQEVLTFRMDAQHLHAAPSHLTKSFGVPPLAATNTKTPSQSSIKSRSVPLDDPSPGHSSKPLAPRLNHRLSCSDLLEARDVMVLHPTGAPPLVGRHPPTWSNSTTRGSWPSRWEKERKKKSFHLLREAAGRV
jgi:hypothetical protein